MGRQDYETETLISIGGFFDPYIYCKDCGKYASSLFCACDDADEKWTEESHFALAVNLDATDGITHSLRGEGFDASEDGSGRGTPLVPVFAGNVIPIADMATRHTDTDGSGGEAGKGHGLGIGGPEDPMFTLTKGDRHSVMSGMAVRRLTPRECERLQGFPDDYTLVPHRGKPAADGPRYKALGNSWAVPCVRWILERMQEVETI